MPSTPANANEGDSGAPTTPPASDEPALIEAASTAREQSTPSVESESGSPAPSSSEPGELDESEAAPENAPAEADGAGSSEPAAPPLPKEPLPGEPVPQQEDDGWEYHWNANTNSYWFYNRISGVWQQENPRLSMATTSAAGPAADTSTGPPHPTGGAPSISAPGSVAGGYNPAIHGDYDPSAWYAQASRAAEDAAEEAAAATRDEAEYNSGGHFNRATGAWQREDQGPGRHTDDAKSRRQLNAFFDVDAAANAHDGRSLKAERAGKKPTKAELKAFKEKRRAKKEEKRRAWLRD